jgi:hypothetical protein
MFSRWPIGIPWSISKRISQSSMYFYGNRVMDWVLDTSPIVWRAYSRRMATTMCPSTSALGDHLVKVLLYGVCKWCCMRRNWALRPCGSTYILRCTPYYPWCWSSRWCSSSPNSSLSRTSRSWQPAAQWKGEEVCVENCGSSSMGESSGEKDSSIIRPVLCLERYHPKLMRAAMETWWRCTWWSRRPDPGWLWCGGLLVS